MLRRIPFVAISIMLLALLGSGCGGSHQTSGLAALAKPPTSQLPAPDLIRPLLTPVTGRQIAGGTAADKQASFWEGSDLHNILGSELYDIPAGNMLLTYKQFEHSTTLDDLGNPRDVGIYYPKCWNGTTSSPAYKYYLWNVQTETDPPLTGEQTISFEWDQNTWHSVPGSPDFELKIQMVDCQENDWVEFVEDDFDDNTVTSLVISNFNHFVNPSGAVLLRIELSTVSSNKPELWLYSISITGSNITLAGTGEGYYHNSTSFKAPNLFQPFELPASVNLSAGCAPLRMQGFNGPCTSWSVADGALNYELQQIYGGLGWNNMDTHYMLSPRYLHVFSADCNGPTQLPIGVTFDVILNYLMNYGCATEEMAPYIYDPVLFFNRSDMPDIYHPTDATIPEKILSLDIENSWGFQINDEDSVESNIKTILALQNRPVMLDLNGSHSICVIGYDDSAGAYIVRDTDHIGVITNLAYGFDGAVPYILYEEYNPITEDLFLRSGSGNTTPYPPPVKFDASMGTAGSVIELSWSLPVTAQWSAGSKYRIHRDYFDNVIAETTAAQYTDYTAHDNFSHSYWVEAVYDAAHRAATRPILGWTNGIEPDPRPIRLATNVAPATPKGLAIGKYAEGQRLLTAWRTTVNGDSEIECSEEYQGGKPVFHLRPLASGDDDYSDLSIGTTIIRLIDNGLNHTGVLYQEQSPALDYHAKFSFFDRLAALQHDEVSADPFLTAGNMKSSLRLRCEYSNNNQLGFGDWYIVYPDTNNQYYVATRPNSIFSSWSFTPLGAPVGSYRGIVRTDLSLLSSPLFNVTTTEVPWRFISTCAAFAPTHQYFKAFYCTKTAGTFVTREVPLQNYPPQIPLTVLQLRAYLGTAYLNDQNTFGIPIPSYFGTVTAPVCFTASRNDPFTFARVSATRSSVTSKNGVFSWVVEPIEDCVYGGANSPEHHGMFGNATALSACFPICAYFSGVQETAKYPGDYGDLKLAFIKSDGISWAVRRIDETPVGNDVAIYTRDGYVYVLFTKYEVDDGTNSIVLWKASLASLMAQ
jgi:hypothetical protein